MMQESFLRLSLDGFRSALVRFWLRLRILLRCLRFGERFRDPGIANLALHGHDRLGFFCHAHLFVGGFEVRVISACFARRVLLVWRFGFIV